MIRLPYGCVVNSSQLEVAMASLRELVLALEHYRQRTSAHLEVDVSQSQAMSYLYSKGDLGQRELGALLGINSSSMTALVDRLERDDIAVRRPHPHDRRKHVVRLTDHGRALVDHTGQWLRHAFDHVNQDDLPVVVAALSSIADDVRRHSPGPADEPLG